MSFELVKLNYAYDALEPVIDKETMEIHHSKHHQAYVNNLNNLIKDTVFEEASLEEILTHLEHAPEEKKNLTKKVQDNSVQVGYGLFVIKKEILK